MLSILNQLKSSTWKLKSCLSEEPENGARLRQMLKVGPAYRSGLEVVAPTIGVVFHKNIECQINLVQKILLY